LLPDLAEALSEKYHEHAKHNGTFRIQRWHEGTYWEDTLELIVKPLYKKATFRSYYNIFYEEPEV
jgi:hypothetical protein